MCMCRSTFITIFHEVLMCHYKSGAKKVNKKNDKFVLTNHEVMKYKKYKQIGNFPTFCTRYAFLFWL